MKTDFDTWEIDETGRRFRRIGNIIEYEPEISGMPRSMFFASLEAQKEQEKQRRKKDAEEKAAAYTGRNCPFKIGRNGVHCECEKACAFYADSSCVFADMDTQATKDTKGLACIFARKCINTCAMYNHGCTLFDIVKGMKKPGKE